MDTKEMLKLLIEGRKQACKDLLVEEVMGDNNELFIARYKAKIEAYEAVLEDMENYV